jgi:hypothetical protein
MENIEVILTVLKKNKKVLNDLRLEVFPAIPKKKIINASKSHSLDLYEEILLMKDFTSTLAFTRGDKSMIITENGISLVRDNKEAAIKFAWTDIENIEFINNCFYIHLDSEAEPTEIDRFFIPSSQDSNNNSSLKFANVLTEISHLFPNQEKKLREGIIAKYEANDFENVIKLYQEYEKGFEYNYKLAILKTEALAELRQFDEAISEINKVFDVIDNQDDKSYLYMAYEIKAKIHELKFESIEALSNYSLALENGGDKDTLGKKIENLYEKTKEVFNEIPISKRQFIIVAKNKINMSADNILVLPKDNLPAISFPIGHPKNLELYVAHPFKEGIYKPYETYENELLEDRKNEFFSLLRCLGATKISFIEKTSNKNLETSEKNNSVNAGIDIKVHSANVDFTTSSNNDALTHNSSKLINVLEFKPSKQPYLAENLLWYKHEPSWASIYEQRMDGNLLKYKEVLKTNKSNLMTNSEAKKLGVAYNNLMVKLHVDLSTQSDFTSLKEESKEIHIEVEFAPLHELIKVEEPIDEIKVIEEKQKEVVAENKIEEKSIIIPAPKNFISKFFDFFLNIFRSK